VLLAFAWLVHGAFGAPDSGVLHQAWLDLQPGLSEHGRMQGFLLDENDFKSLEKGRIIKKRGKGAGGAQRVDTIVWMPLDARLMWLAIHDDQHNNLNEGLVEEALLQEQDGAKVLYQSIGLPIPFEDRFWVIQITNNTEIYQATDRKVLERTWNLYPEGLSMLSPKLQVENEGKVWTPANEGGWLVIQVGGQGCLVLYRVDTDVGGFVPDGFVGRFTLARMDELMTRMRAAAEEMPQHYNESHPRIVLPGGEEIPPWLGEAQ